jgi:ribonucleotide monophosphatase NagD (HAD superfamily)
MTQIVPSLSEISNRYDALFVDLWGCVHNGITAHPEAVAALQAYRKSGGVVVLLTNSPKPRKGVAKQLASFGVPNDVWDTIATSGVKAVAEKSFDASVNGDAVVLPGIMSRKKQIIPNLKV